jgi:hypothetical protein
MEYSSTPPSPVAGSHLWGDRDQEIPSLETAAPNLSGVAPYVVTPSRLRRRERHWVGIAAGSRQLVPFPNGLFADEVGKPPDFEWFHDDFVRLQQGCSTGCSRCSGARTNRAFLIRLETGKMRNSVVKSFVREIKGFIRFSSLRQPGGYMLWTIFVVLLVLWLLGFSLHIGGALIHLLLVVGLVVLVINLLSGRRSAV